MYFRVESRKPERYSSAAPLSRKFSFKNRMMKVFQQNLTRNCFIYYSADARLRIVSERVDIVDNLIISISVTPDKITTC